MQPSERRNLQADVATILGHTTTRRGPVPNVVLAQVHAQTWRNLQVPAPTEERGGSSSPTEIEERRERDRVTATAGRDADQLPGLVDTWQTHLRMSHTQGTVLPGLVDASARLARVIARCTSLVDHSKLPADVDGCTSCARTATINGRKYHGHPHIPVYDKARTSTLCRWCYDYQRAEQTLPPVEIIDIYHRVGARAAGLELAKRARR